MTEAEAWREIARRIVEGDWSRLGLCREVRFLHRVSAIAFSVHQSMAKRLTRHLIACGRIWAYPEGTEPEARALAALWLALEAEEEAA